MNSTPVDVVLSLVHAINGRNLGAIVNLMTENHVFTDSLGMTLEGRKAMRDAWAAYFVMIPDYHIAVTEVMSRDNVVALFGTASGTFTADGTLLEKNRWQRPAAWRAVVQNDQIALWQVYADNEPVRAIMRA